MKRLCLLAALCALGCSEEGPGMHAPDMTAQADLSTVRDLSMPDLSTPSCGQIILCVFQCGVTNITCDQGCVTNAQPQAIQEAGALVLCAAQNCLLTDGGVNPSDMLSLLSCIEQQCPNEVNGCEGLPFAGSPN